MFDPMMALEDKGSPNYKLFILNINECTKFHDNPSNSWEISLKATNVKLMVELEEEDNESH